MPIYILIAVIVLLIVARPFKIITSEEVGIRVTNGAYSPIPLNAGLHFFVPFIQNIIVLDARVRVMSYTSTEQTARIGDAQQKFTSSSFSDTSDSSIIAQETISVKDAMGLDFHIDLAVSYSLNREEVSNTISVWGTNWENKIIDLTVREVVREVAGRYNAEDIPQKRNEIAEVIKADITKIIDAKRGKPVILESVQLREIILPEKVRQQIAEIQVTKNQVKQAEQEAEKQVALAKGEADAMKTRAQGKADAIKIEADANAYANLQLGKSLNSQLLQLRQIETQAKFNEALKENKDAQIFLTPGGAVPNIWVDTKDKQRQSSIGQ